MPSHPKQGHLAGDSEVGSPSLTSAPNSFMTAHQAPVYMWNQQRVLGAGVEEGEVPHLSFFSKDRVCFAGVKMFDQ